MEDIVAKTDVEDKENETGKRVDIEEAKGNKTGVTEKDEKKINGKVPNGISENGGYVNEKIQKQRYCTNKLKWNNQTGTRIFQNLFNI